jgi:plasmid stabilization system protein ParE
MKCSLVIRPKAKSDLQEAFRWYEEQRKGLGLSFLLCVEAGLESIQENPNLCSIIHGPIRRKLIRRFPFGIFYVVRESRISVLAILHCRRDPAEWKKRAIPDS